MKKMFKITKSTSHCQRLVAVYSNMEDNTAELQEKKKEIFKEISSIIYPELSEILAIRCFHKGITKDDISIDEFNEFVTESMLFFIDNYDPLYCKGYYGRSANFDTYYIACFKYIIDMYLHGVRFTNENYQNYMKNGVK